MDDRELMFSCLHLPGAGITTGVHHHTQLDWVKRHAKTFTYMTSSNLYKDPECEWYYHPIFQMGKVKPRLFKPVSKDSTVPTRLWPLKVGHTEGTGLHCRIARPTFQRSVLTSQAPLQNGDTTILGVLCKKIRIPPLSSPSLPLPWLCWGLNPGSVHAKQVQYHWASHLALCCFLFCFLMRFQA